MLQRAKSTLTKRRKMDESKAEPRPVHDSIEEAVQEHRKSMFFRPKSAGNDKPRRSASRPRTATAVNHEKPLPILNSSFQHGGEIMEFKAGLETFSFPTPRSATTSLSSVKIPVASGSPLIGVALGSPSQAPPAWGRSHPVGRMSNRVPHARPHLQHAATVVVEETNLPTSRRDHDAKKRKSGWKSWGSLFRAKSTRNQACEPFHTVESNKTAMEPMHHTPLARPQVASEPLSPTPVLQSPSTITRHHCRSPSVTRGQARLEARAETDRASFMPQVEARMNRTPSLPSSPLPAIVTFPLRVSMDNLKPLLGERHDSPMAIEPPMSDVALPRMPRLDLDIPKPDMERYSVMFEKLLVNEPKQSILERRQSKQKRIAVGSATGVASNEIITNKIIQSPGGIPRRSMSVVSPVSKHMHSLTIKVHDNSDKADAESTKISAMAFHRPRPKRSLTAPTLPSPAFAPAPPAKDVPFRKVPMKGQILNNVHCIDVPPQSDPPSSMPLGKEHVHDEASQDHPRGLRSIVLNPQDVQHKPLLAEYQRLKEIRPIDTLPAYGFSVRHQQFQGPFEEGRHTKDQFAVPIVIESVTDHILSAVSSGPPSLPHTPMTATSFYDDCSSADTRVATPGPEWEMFTTRGPPTTIPMHVPSVTIDGATPTNLGHEASLPSARTASGFDRQHQQYAKSRSMTNVGKQIVQVSVARQVSVSQARERVDTAQESKQPMRPRVVQLTKRSRHSTAGVVESGSETDGDAGA